MQNSKSPSKIIPGDRCRKEMHLNNLHNFTLEYGGGVEPQELRWMI
jgi:hypothetical protein